MSRFTEKDRGTLAKIEYEGGIYEALAYGVKESDFDNADLKAAWSGIVAAHQECVAERSQIEASIEESRAE